MSDESKGAWRTYSLLGSRSSPLSEYDIVTSRLLYHTELGFEVKTPLVDWYERYQRNSRFCCDDWEKFSDPRQTTYTTYTRLQKEQELEVDRLFEDMERSGYDRGLSPQWLDVLCEIMAPARYPCHGLHMVACYVGQMAPTGRVTMTSLFQAADELRRIERLAYRVRALQEARPGFGENSQSKWQEAPFWQPLRETLEKLLVVYDWGEAFVGLNLCLKPIFDEVLMRHFARLARQRGDGALGHLLDALYADCRWQRDWSQALVVTVLAEAPGTAAALRDWVDKWSEPSIHACSALLSRIDAAGDGGRSLRGFHQEWLSQISLGGAEEIAG